MKKPYPPRVVVRRGNKIVRVAELYDDPQGVKRRPVDAPMATLPADEPAPEEQVVNVHKRASRIVLTVLLLSFLAGVFVGKLL